MSPPDGGRTDEPAPISTADPTNGTRLPIAGLAARSPAAIAEAAVLTLAIPAIGFGIDRSDPFFLKYHFPWLVFAPLLIALRHGFTLGFGSSVALDVALVLAWRTGAVSVDRFPAETLVGLITLAMVSGQFSDLWKREIVRLDSGFGVLQKQADRLARSHFLLEMSHDRLDEQVERRTSSLREGMAAVRDLASAHEGLSLTDHGAAMMDVFAAYCGLEVGELFAVERGVLGRRCAALGRAYTMRPDDPLVARAIRARQLTYLPAATLPDREDRERRRVTSPLLAVIPFVDATGTVRALLCVQAMPFISFEKRNLEAMATLAEHFADLVASSGAGGASAVESA
jgi:hypothetical protein